MQDISINKVKLIKQGEKLELGLEEQGTVESEGDRTFKNPCHPDLIKAMNGLKCHFAIMTDYLTEKNAMNQEDLEKFTIYGYSIGGKEDAHGITITGGRKTRSGKMITINTPFLLLDSDPEAYLLIADLNNKILDIEAEVEKYLGGKQQQLDMFAEQEKEKVDKLLIDHPEDLYAGSKEAMPTGTVVSMEEKKKNRKKVAQSAEVPSGEMVVND